MDQRFRTPSAKIDLVGMAGIARRLGIKEDRVRQWRSRGLLPAPYQDEDVPGLIWEWSSVRRHIERQGLLSGDDEKPVRL